MFESILVPLDGSRLSQAVLRPVTFLARGLKSRVTLLYVLEPAVEAADTEIEAEASKQRDNVRPLVETYLADVAATLRQQKVAVETVVLTGKPHEVIVNCADERGFDVVAMATHGRRGLARAMVGSVATRVLHACPCPLLLVRPRRQRGFWVAPRRLSQILLPLDGSDHSEAALPVAEDLARRLGLLVTLVQVIPVSIEVTLGPNSTFVWNAGTEFESRLDVISTGYLSGVGRKLAERGVNVDWDALRGKAAHAVVERARRDTSTLIVMATRGRSGLGRWVVGGVADEVVRESKVPVLLVPPPRAQQRET